MDYKVENCQLENEVDGRSYVSKIKSFLGKASFSLISGQWNDKIYSMKYEIKGQCHIFSHKNFQSSVGVSFIEETDLDTQLLDKTFKDLKFNVTLHKDYTLKKIRKVIAEVSQKDHSEYSCLVCCFLSYGSQTELYAADESYDIESVLSPFCNSLTGKPKIFIFQAKKPIFCKDISRESADSGLSDFIKRKRCEPLRIPLFSDILCAISTFSGSYTLTNGQKVSNFIRLLCHDLLQHHGTFDMLMILTLVNSKMVQLFQSPELEENFHYRSTLTRMLKLT